MPNRLSINKQTKGLYKWGGRVRVMSFADARMLFAFGPYFGSRKGKGVIENEVKKIIHVKAKCSRLVGRLSSSLFALSISWGVLGGRCSTGKAKRAFLSIFSSTMFGQCDM